MQDMESEDYEFYKGLDFLCNNQVNVFFKGFTYVASTEYHSILTDHVGILLDRGSKSA